MSGRLGRSHPLGGGRKILKTYRDRLRGRLRVACFAVEPLEGRTLLSSYTFSALASFVSTGNHPQAGVIQDSSGDLFGVTPNGAAYDDGSIWEVPQGTNTLQMLLLFNGTNGAEPTSLVLDPSSGTLYGTTDSSSSGAATLFEFAGGQLTTLHTFNSGTDGSAPDALILSGGNLFGTASGGGGHTDGTIFEWNLSTKGFSTLWSFSGSDGANPSGGLLFDSSGKLDGTANAGGANTDGAVFQFNPTSPGITLLHSFNGTDGKNPNSLVIDPNTGNLYGTTNAGGTGDGTVFQIVAGAFNSIHSFTGTDGVNPDALVLDSVGGNLYGTTLGGGTGSNGSIFSIATATNAFAPLASFGAGVAGINPQGGLLLSGGNLLGTASEGGSLDEGTVFQLNISTNALGAVVNFGNPTGDASVGDMIPDGSGHFFGIGGAGGIGDDAGVWEFDPASNTISPAALFTGDNGADPDAIVWDATNSMLYGVTQVAGTNTNSGTLFDVVDGVPVALHQFVAGTDGSAPNALVLNATTGKFFGTTNTDGPNNDGTIFEFDPTTNSLTTLFSFKGSNGAHPSGSLLLGADGNLYGTTTGGGSKSDGTVFQYNLTTMNIAVLASFNGTNGSDPEGDIALDSSENVYGTTLKGGGKSKGTIFEEAGGKITSLFTFNNSDTPNPNGVIRDSSGNLYGTSFSGGANDLGQVFELSNGTFTILHSFNGSDGANPDGGLYMDGSGNLWGSTEDGGARFVGVVYELALPVPPRVSNVTVDGSAWAGGYLTYLTGLNAANVNGYSIPTGSAQTNPLPWTNLNQINITFNENVTVTQGSLQLISDIPSNTYMFSAFSYNATTDTATWTLTAPIAADKLLIDLSSASATNSSGQTLDGEWTDGTSTYPSGNGTAGGDFTFSFDVLPGDVDQSGGVNILDTIAVRNSQGSSTSTPGTYNPLMDVDGSGGINILDTISVRNLQGSLLPAGSPMPPAVVSTATDLLKSASALPGRAKKPA